MSHVSREMVLYCFDVLLGYLNGEDEKKCPFVGPVGGLFVTWNSSKELRGCIGCLSNICLSELGKYALRSSQSDSRFTPIGLSEVDNRLTCTVSLLHTFEVCADKTDWTVGNHGIVAEFTCTDSRIRTATFLPDVMTEQKWNHTDALIAAARKCGASKHTHVKVTRYQSSKMTLNYAEI